MPRWLIAPLIAAACASQHDSGAQREVPSDAVPVLVRGTFVTTPLAANATINGAAFYHGSDGARWIISSTSNDALAVFEGATGALLRTVGVRGMGMGELGGPEGIVVLGDSIALVVERDNGRVQGFHLPDFTSLGTFGDRLIGKPTAIDAYLAGNAYSIYVAYNSDTATVRIAQFRLTVGKRELIAIHWRTFGDTSGSGAIHLPAGIAVDSEHDRLLIADAREGASTTKVYDLDGRFTGRVLNTGNGGIALYACSDNGGYWVTGHRQDSANTFHVSARGSLERLGGFADTTGQMVRIFAATSRQSANSFRGGILAARGDGGAAMVSWDDVAAALHLRERCAGR